MINLLAMLRPIAQKGTDVQRGLPGPAGDSDESSLGFANLIQKLVGEFVGGRTVTKSDLKALVDDSNQALTCAASKTTDALPASGNSKPPAEKLQTAVATKKKGEDEASENPAGNTPQMGQQVTSTAVTEGLVAIYAALKDPVPSPNAPLAEGAETPTHEAEREKGTASAAGPAFVSSLTAGKITTLFSHGLRTQGILSFPMSSNPPVSGAQSAEEGNRPSGSSPTDHAKTERPGTLVLDMLKTVSASKNITPGAPDFADTKEKVTTEASPTGSADRRISRSASPLAEAPAVQPPDPKELEIALGLQPQAEWSPSTPPQGEPTPVSNGVPEHPDVLAKETTIFQPAATMVAEAAPTLAKPVAAPTKLSVQPARGAERASNPARPLARTLSPQMQGESLKEPTPSTDKTPLRQIYAVDRQPDSEPREAAPGVQEKAEPAETAGSQNANAPPADRKQQAEVVQTDAPAPAQLPSSPTEVVDLSAVRALSGSAHPEIAAVKSSLTTPTVRETPSPYSGAPGELSWKIADQVIRTVKLQMTDGASEMRLTLKPPSLGEVQLNVRVEDTKMNAQIDVSQQVVKSAIEAHLPQLRQTLQEQGIDVQRIDVLLPDQYSRRDGTGSGADGSARHPAKQFLSADDTESYQTQKDMGYNTMELIM